MGVRFNSVSSSTFVGPLPASNAETVIVASPPLTPALDFSPIFIFWWFVLLAGTGTTSIVVNLRRTSGIGALVVNAPAITLAAGNTGMFHGSFADSPGAVSGQQYSVTVQQTGATAAGTMQAQSIIAFAL